MLKTFPTQIHPPLTKFSHSKIRPDSSSNIIFTVGNSLARLFRKITTFWLKLHKSLPIYQAYEPQK